MTEAHAAPLARWNMGSRVYSVAISHDGTLIAAGSYDSHVRVWDVHTGALVLGPLKGHTSWIRSVTFCPNNNRIVSGSGDRTIRIWNAHTGALIGQPISGHTSYVRSVAFSPDSTRIVSGSCDKTIRVWDSNTGVPIGEPLNGHTSYVYSVAFSQDSFRIVSGSRDKTIRIWDIHTGAPIGEPLRGHTNSVTSVVFSHDSARIISGSWDHTVCIWDAWTGAMIGKPLSGHTDLVRSVAFSLDSTRIVSGSEDKTIRVWDARTGAPIGEPLMGHTSDVRSVVFSPDTSRIVSFSGDGTIYVWKAPQSALSYDMSTPSFDSVASKMSTQEIFDCLVKHGCADLSSSIDPARYSKFAVASGGFGDVWQAWMRDGTLVAIKCLQLHVTNEGDEEDIKLMARELQHWSNVRHENIQELLGIVVFQDRLGMASLWMENGNLQQYIEKNPDVDRYPLCVQIATGVAYLHGIGMVHGDIKAFNVLVSSEGILRIGHFHSAVLSESTSHFAGPSQVGEGRIRWMAPELHAHQEGDEGDRPLSMQNQETDVYALGMTMLETISGKVPYHQITSEQGVVYALSNKQRPKRPEELSGPEERATRMWDLLLTCWDYDPLARPRAALILESLNDMNALHAFDMVTSKMSAQEMFGCLVKHGCSDLTTSVDADRRASAVIASGGFGDVRRITLDDGKSLAVKTLRLHILLKDDDKAVKRAVREVYMWSRLHHPNVQELLGIVEFQGGLGMVSPWMDQGNLQEYIAANPSLERYPLCVQLATGVSYLHSIEMVHGDLKASNVLVSNNGTLKINDFDYAILSNTTLRFTATTRHGGGTLRWMAPELLQPEEEDESGRIVPPATRSKQTDAYALGMTMLEVITGDVPYAEYRSDMGIYRAIHAKDPPRRPKELSNSHEQDARMWELLMQCWDHDPAVRPTAATVLKLLDFDQPWEPIATREKSSASGRSRFARLKNVYNNILR